MFRTDMNNNPTAFTVDIAHEAGLILNTDYVPGDPFKDGSNTYYTAKLLGDSVQITIKVLDKIGFYTGRGELRWVYIAIPFVIWKELSLDQKKQAIQFMYHREGGETLKIV